jgi:hypothetical protein
MIFQPGLKSLQRTEGVDNCSETWHVNVRLVYKSATAVSFSLLSSSLKNKLWAVPWLRSLVAGLSPRRPGFAPGSIYVGFVVDKVTLGQVFSEFFGFPCQYHSTVALRTHIIWGMRNMLT